MSLLPFGDNPPVNASNFTSFALAGCEPEIVTPYTTPLLSLTRTTLTDYDTAVDFGAEYDDYFKYS